jgi:hypothetical protein
VVRNALQIKDDLHLCINDDILSLAAIWHDVATEIDRTNHHLIGGELFAKAARKHAPDLPVYLVEAVVKAIEEHRASYKGAFSSIYSEVLSAADRGKPDINGMIHRSWSYSNRPDKSDMETATDVATHLKEKYGLFGYARYPDLYLKVYKNDISTMKAYFETITPAMVLEACQCSVTIGVSTAKTLPSSASPMSF